MKAFTSGEIIHKFTMKGQLVILAIAICFAAAAENKATKEEIRAACKGQPLGALVSHPTDCTKFVQCIGIDPPVTQCPAQLYFNPNLQVCDYPQNVDCKDHKSESVDKTKPDNHKTNIGNQQKPTGKDDLEGACKGHPHGSLLPHPEDCTKFVQCVGLKPVVHQCPGGLYFNPDLQVCDYPQNVKCDNDKIN